MELAPEDFEETSLAWIKMQELVYRNPMIPSSPLRPSPKQIAMLACDAKECLIGGAKGGGKSESLLMAALMYVSVPGYAALLIRRTYGDLVQDGGLVPRSKEWIGLGELAKSVYPNTEPAIFREKTMSWEFPLPNGISTLKFGYYDSDEDKDRYQGGAWIFAGLDESTFLKEKWYAHIFSCLRKPSWVCKNCKQALKRDFWKDKKHFWHEELGSCVAPDPVPMPCNHLGLSVADVPIRLFSGSNPGGVSHEFFKRRFVVPGAPKYFIPSRLYDNPGLDKKEYAAQLDVLDPITRRQYKEGDWNAYMGGRFQREWFREFWVTRDRNNRPIYKWSNADVDGQLHSTWPTCPLDGIPVDKCFNFITCDPAATEADKEKGSTTESDSDYTAIGAFAVTPSNEIFVLEVVRERLAIENIVPRISLLAQDYGALFVAIEDMTFQRGIIREGQRSLNVPVERIPTEGKSKLVRATPSIIRASEGQYFIPKDEPMGKHPWLGDFISELCQFSGDDKLDSYSDQADMFSYSTLALLRHGLASPVLVNPEEDRGEDVGIFMSDDQGEGYRWER